MLLFTTLRNKSKCIFQNEKNKINEKLKKVFFDFLDEKKLMKE